MKNDSSLTSRKLLIRAAAVCQAVVLLLAVLLLQSCARIHLSQSHGASYEQIFQFQATSHLTKEELPQPMSGEDAELAMKSIYGKKDDSGAKSNAAGTMQLISLQR